MITSRSIERILDAVRIEEVVGDFVNLRRRGVNLIGLCPFHPEKTPSFNVSPAKNLFKCFGCGKGGDAIAFLKEHESFSYPEALRYLAGRYHIEIEETEAQRSDDPEEMLKDQLFVINQYARDFFVRQLWETEEGKSIGLSYFKERGFREAIMRKFELGYAPASGSTFTLQAVQQGFQAEILQKAGLCGKGNRDFFRDRVMFTIHSLSGKPLAFAGRIMGKATGPKYVNSPETPIYHKSNVLYGLFQARQAIRKHNQCLLVEGYTDVLSLYQEGIENVVASSGTALTPEQVRLIRRFTSNLTILYDGDAAGLNAAMRGLDIILEQDMNVRVVMLPGGHDPDSYLAEVGREGFLDYLKNSQQDFILFKTTMLLDETREDPIGKARVTREIVSTIARVSDNIKRAEYTKVCADRLQVDEALLIREINVALAQRLEKVRKDLPPEPSAAGAPDPMAIETGSAPAGPAVTSVPIQEKDLLRVLILFGSQMIASEEQNQSVAAFILDQLDEEVLQDMEDATFREAMLLLKAAHDQGVPLDPPFFRNHPLPLLRDLAIGFLNQEEEYSENWEKRWNIILHNQPMPEENYRKDAHQALYRFQLKHLDRMCELNGKQIKDAYASRDEERLLHYLGFQAELQRLRNELALKQLNATILR